MSKFVSVRGLIQASRQLFHTISISIVAMMDSRSAGEKLNCFRRSGSTLLQLQERPGNDGTVGGNIWGMGMVRNPWRHNRLN